MKQVTDCGTWPPALWSVICLDQSVGTISYATFDGVDELDRGERRDLDLSGWFMEQRRSGTDFIAVASRVSFGSKGPEAGDIDESMLVALDDWSAILGIRPRLIAATVEAVTQRTAILFGRLCDLDPDTLQRSISQLLDRSSGERRMLQAALQVSIANHGPHAGMPVELQFLAHRDKPERLKRLKGGQAVDPDSMDTIFRVGGPIAANYDAWEQRPQQTEMSSEVARVLATGGELIAEAGTGTGKSLAYLVPALTHAIQTGEQVVVATNTRVLQDQLAQKDAPIAISALRETHPDDFARVQVLKGRGNYLCLRRWFADAQQNPLSTDDEEATFRSRATIWLAVTESGEQAELPLEGAHNRYFNRVSAEGEACDASKCQFQQRNQCFLYRARRNAEAAHIVITNHALLLTDVVQGGEALPDAKHLIIDEAHHLEDQATTSFQTATSMRLINQAINQLTGEQRRSSPGLLTEIGSIFASRQIHAERADYRDRLYASVTSALNAAESARSLAVSLFNELAEIVDAFGVASREYATRVRITTGVRHAPAWNEIERRWDALNLGLASLGSALSELTSLVPDESSISTGDDRETAQLLVRIEDLENRLGTSKHLLNSIGLELNNAIHNPLQDNVYWLESRKGERRDTVLYTAPLQLGDYLRRHLYSRLDSLVLTSATMTTGGNTKFVRNRLGLPDADELQLSSPFDYQSNGLVVIPSDVPEPNQPGFDVASHHAILDTAIAAEGRTLVLFTSISAMNNARSALGEQFALAGLQLVTQHEDGSAEQLAERLRSFDRTVVFGAGAFWEGIDISGPALSALVITKLPFAVPTDPVVAARSETFENAFMDYSLPLAILKVRQGFGRLIRTQTDRGVCVLLDRRLVSKRYGGLILDALPRTRRDYCTLSQIGPTVAQFLEKENR